MTLDDLRRNRELLFWGLHTLGWSAYFITQYLGALLYEKPASYIKVLLAAAASGFLLSAPLRYFYRWLWRQRPAVIIPARTVRRRGPRRWRGAPCINTSLPCISSANAG